MTMFNPNNKRVYYAIHAVGFANNGIPFHITGGGIGGGLATYGSGVYRGAKGVQSVGINTTFNLEQVFELGQLELYENIETIPNVEVTIEKVLDGHALIQHLATQSGTVSTLAGRYNDNQCGMLLSIYDITRSSASGAPLTEVFMSGLYVNGITFNIPVDGNMTEQVTLVGNDKTWYYDTSAPSGEIFLTGTRFNGDDSPVLASGGVQRRENVNMTQSLWPTVIPGITGNNTNPTVGTSYGAHIQSVNISTNLGRTELFELGKFGPYFRYANFPVEVTTSIEVTASEYGDAVNVSSAGGNLTDQPIKICLNGGIIIDCGTRNKLASVNFAGGDTGGGNKTVTYNFSNFNSLTVLSSGDPARLTS